MLSDADAALAERRKLVKITGDATRKEFDAQQAGFPSTGRVREFGEKAAEEGSKIEEESSAGLGGGDRKSGVEGKSVSVSVDRGGGRSIKKKNTRNTIKMG